MEYLSQRPWQLDALRSDKRYERETNAAQSVRINRTLTNTTAKWTRIKKRRRRFLVSAAPQDVQGAISLSAKIIGPTSITRPVNTCISTFNLRHIINLHRNIINLRHAVYKRAHCCDIRATRARASESGKFYLFACLRKRRGFHHGRWKLRDEGSEVILFAIDLLYTYLYNVHVHLDPPPSFLA